MENPHISAYELLRMFSELPSHSSFDKLAPTWTPRLLKIKELLEMFKISYKIKHYVVPGYESRYFTNFYISFNKDSGEKGLLFLAHHDINNEMSENSQDNTSSVCQLFSLMQMIKNKELTRPIHFVFVDSEEHVNFNCCGSQVLSEDIYNGEFGQLEICINLELTGLGKNIWVSNYEKFPEPSDGIIEKLNAHRVITPYNDAYVLSLYDVPAICIGLLDDDDINTITKKLGYPKIWSLCHSMEDTFDKVSEKDMILFQNSILNII